MGIGRTPETRLPRWRRFWRSLLAGALLTVTLAAPAAGMTIGLYREGRTSADQGVQRLMQSYVGGVLDGILITNLVALVMHDRPLFCLPPSIKRLTLETVLPMIDRQIVIEANADARSGTHARGEDIGTVLFDALQETYPCKRK